jgi:phenylacetate-CoA ligase
MVHKEWQSRSNINMALNVLVRRGIYLTAKQLAGSGFYSRLNLLRGTQYLPRSESRRMQEELLQRLVSFAYEMVPYYRNRLRDAGVVNSNGKVMLQNYTNLPPLTKQVIREHYGQLLSLDVSERRRIRKFFTGGTTGDPLAPYADLKYWDWCLAETSLFYEWMGLKLGMPYVYYWGAPQDLGRQGVDLRSNFWLGLVQNRFVLNCRLLSDEIMAYFIREINKRSHYRHIVACVHELNDLACFSLEHHLPIKTRFNGISVTTAELTESMRHNIETAFNCRVYSRYGSREVGDIACECSFQRGLHINPLYSYIEVVDDHGHPMPPGQEGRILVTNLHNEVMPLLRYEIQDLGIMQEESDSCACGRNWDTFAKITGRLHERLTLPDGSTFGKVFLHYAMEVFTGLRGYQLHQLNNNNVEVHLVASESDYLDIHQEEMDEAYSRLKRCTGNQLHITFRQVDRLQTAPSGKRLLIVKKQTVQDLPELQEHILNDDLQPV